MFRLFSERFLITTARSWTCTLRPGNCTLRSSILSLHPPSCFVIVFICNEHQVSTGLRFSESYCHRPPFDLSQDISHSSTSQRLPVWPSESGCLQSRPNASICQLSPHLCNPICLSLVHNRRLLSPAFSLSNYLMDVNLKFHI
jgi:hypothetical protein